MLDCLDNGGVFSGLGLFMPDAHLFWSGLSGVDQEASIGSSTPTQ